ncbi:MAG TPA: hypothetical protein VEB40_08700 [Flavipsychrobacter sp.]|nr:hypothetical protein [Flavipsychrobacter sp.]
MKKLIKYTFLTALVAALGLLLTPQEYLPQAMAQVQTRTYTYLHHVFKKSVIVGTTKPSPADSSSWLQIGDSAGARYHIYFAPTDTGKIAIAKRKSGCLVYNNSDERFYLWDGEAWQTLAFVDDLP